MSVNIFSSRIRAKGKKNKAKEIWELQQVEPQATLQKYLEHRWQGAAVLPSYMLHHHPS